MNVEADINLRSFTDCERIPDFIEDNKQMEKHLHFLSGGLAEWKNHEYTEETIAQLVHQSVKDYFVDRGFQYFDNSLDSMERTLSSAHARLCRSCIVYFDMNEVVVSFQQLGALPTDPSYFEKQDLRWKRRRALTKIHPFLFYAIDSWLQHAQIVEQSGYPKNDLLSFLQKDSARTIQHWTSIHQLSKYPQYPSKTTVLHVASCSNLVSLVSTFISRIKQPIKTETDSKDDSDMTPLLLAAERGYEAVMKLLIETGQVEPESKDTRGRTPLSLAAGGGHEAVVKLLQANTK
jgi:hypothetical protein